MHRQHTQIAVLWKQMAEPFTATKGSATFTSGPQFYNVSGQSPISCTGAKRNPCQAGHLSHAIPNNKPLNQAGSVARNTMTAIVGWIGHLFGLVELMGKSDLLRNWPCASNTVGGTVAANFA